MCVCLNIYVYRMYMYICECDGLINCCDMKIICTYLLINVLYMCMYTHVFTSHVVYIYIYTHTCV